MTLADFLQRLRSPKETLKTALLTIVLATISIIGTQISTGLYNILYARLEFPMVVAGVESLRQDLQTVPCTAIPMMANQAVEVNRIIDYRKEVRRHWWSYWMVHPDWLAVRRLQIPCRPLREMAP